MHSVTNSRLFRYFWELPVKRRTVGGILSNKETYNSEDDQGTRTPQTTS